MRRFLASVRRAWLFAAVLVVVLPIGLGPATSTVARWLGGEPAHVCMCGMKRGTCGCPECEHLEAERRAEQRIHRYAIVHRTCDDGDGVVVAPALPVVVASGHAVAVMRASYVRAPPPVVASLRSLLPSEPSTPPPRA